MFFLIPYERHQLSLCKGEPLISPDVAVGAAPPTTAQLIDQLHQQQRNSLTPGLVFVWVALVRAAAAPKYKGSFCGWSISQHCSV
jgi:hypothetical protein